MATAAGHRTLTHAALETLPAWERDLMRPHQEALETVYCMYGDNYFIDPKTIGPFIEMPDGRLPMDPWEIRHFRKEGPGLDFYTCGYYELMRDAFEYFSARCIEQVQQGDYDTFARFLGSIAHVIQDSGTPAHAVGTNLGTDLKLVKLLYPCKDPVKMAAQFHPILECRYESFTLDYRPRLLGVTPAEISFRLLDRFTDMIEHAIGFVLPVLDAYYRDEDAILTQTLTRCGRFSSEVLADFIHTLIAVGSGRIDHEELESIRLVDVGALTPLERTAWAPSPYPYAEIRNAPWNLDRQPAPVPLSLLTDGMERIHEAGFGLGPPFQMTYHLPPGIFARFDSAVGLSSRLSAEAGVTFEVWGDDHLLVRASCATTRDTRTLSCDLAQVKKLTLKITPMGDTVWPSHTHAVWGSPRLLK